MTSTPNSSSRAVKTSLSLPVGQRWFELSVSRAQSVDGQAPRFIVLSRDITERKNAEEALKVPLHEKEALLKEVHHRVKNNLQVITSLLRLETGRSGDEGTKVVLREMQGRIRSMALLHETLYRSGNFAQVDLAVYLRQLATQLFRGQNTDPVRVALRLDLATNVLAIDRAIPCGLIVNELLTNAIKYGFPDEGADLLQEFGETRPNPRDRRHRREQGEEDGRTHADRRNVTRWRATDAGLISRWAASCRAPGALLSGSHRVGVRR